MFRLTLILLCFIFPLISLATNAGIVQGLWYGTDAFFAGEEARIYVAVRNNTGADLSGTVEFFVNDKKIERKNIEALDGRIIESWADWTPSYGTSTVSATLSRTEISSTASGTQAVEVVSALAEDIIFVDRDTDGDDVGDREDTDDDGDGISDTDEAKNGTDPLVYDEPEDTETAAPETEEDKKEAKPTRSNTNDQPQGLEQFLSDSRAKQVLKNTTRYINDTHSSLHSYRQARNDTNTSAAAEDNAEEPNTDTSTSSSTTKTGSSSFGNITRTNNETSGFWKHLEIQVRNLISGIYTLLLFGLSQYLAHPVVVQISFLLLLLYLLYRVAKKFGARPSN